MKKLLSDIRIGWKVLCDGYKIPFRVVGFSFGEKVQLEPWNRERYGVKQITVTKEKLW